MSPFELSSAATGVCQFAMHRYRNGLGRLKTDEFQRTTHSFEMHSVGFVAPPTGRPTDLSLHLVRVNGQHKQQLRSPINDFAGHVRTTCIHDETVGSKTVAAI